MKIITTQKSSSTRKFFVDQAAMLIPVISYAVPALSTYKLMTSPVAAIAYPSILLSPVIFSIIFVLVAGLMSIPSQSGIVAGKFKRDTGTQIYGKRRIYGACWTTVFYCKPVFFILLSNKHFKKMMFRLFGYKGSMDFTTYPDCWMRDLPLLDIRKGAYLSNRCTMGTNICHKEGMISVGKITVGENSIVGHLAMIAHGVIIGNDSEVGVGACLGLNVKLGNNVLIGPTSGINHYSVIGDNVSIGAKSIIGCAVVIAANIKVPAGALIPDKAKILTQNDVNKYISSTYVFNAASLEDMEIAKIA